MEKRKTLFRLLMIIIGNTIYALAVALFIMPNGLITGGTTGLALFINHITNIPVSAFVAVWNIVMFIIGAVILGKAFAMKTLLSTFYYPVVLEIIQKIIDNYKVTEDVMLATVCAGLMIGFAIGLVILAGASTGGMDIPPLVLNKKFKMSVSVTMYVIDFVVLILQMAFTSVDKILYGIILVLLYTVTLGKILAYGENMKKAEVQLHNQNLQKA